MTRHDHQERGVLITITRAAEIIGVSRSTVMRRVRDGDLDHEIKVPGERGAYLLHPDVVERERQRVQAEREAALARSHQGHVEY